MVDQLGWGHRRGTQRTAKGGRNPWREVPDQVQHFPGQVADVEFVAPPVPVCPRLGRVVQQRLCGEVGEADPLAGQGPGDVLACAALEVRRGALSLHDAHVLIELRVGLRGFEMLEVAHEVVTPKRRKRRTNHPQAAQQHQRVRQFTAGPIGVGKHAHRSIADIETGRDPTLLPGLAGVGGQHFQQPLQPSAPVVAALPTPRPHLVDDGGDLLRSGRVEVTARTRWHRRAGRGRSRDDLPLRG